MNEQKYLAELDRIHGEAFVAMGETFIAWANAKCAATPWIDRQSVLIAIGKAASKFGHIAVANGFGIPKADGDLVHESYLREMNSLVKQQIDAGRR